MSPATAFSKVKDAATAVGETAGAVLGSAEDIGRSAAAVADRVRVHAADLLQDASEVVDSAADRLDTAATFVRNHQVADAWTGMRQVVRRHPGRSVGLALATGVCLGLALRMRHK